MLSVTGVSLLAAQSDWHFHFVAMDKSCLIAIRKRNN